MPPEHRREMRERFDRWSHMEPETREQRLERARRLKGLVHEVYTSMNPELRVRVDAMESAEKRRYLVRLALEEARKRGREVSLHGKGPVDGRPGGRPPHGGGPPRGGSPEERAAHKERAEKFQASVRESLRSYAQANGVPAGIAPKEWEEALVAQGREQGKLIRRLVHEYPELRAALPKPPWAKPLDPRRKVLHHAMRLRPESHLRLMEAAPAERKTLEWSLRREQLVNGMRAASEFDQAEVKKVEAMKDSELRTWLKENGIRSGSGFRRGRDGHPRERGDRGPRRGRGDRGERGDRRPPGPDRKGPPGPRPPRSNKEQKPGSGS